MSPKLIFAAALCCATASCAAPTHGTTTVTSARVPPHQHAAEALLVETAGCWMGSMWGDSERARCEQVVASVFGRPDHWRYVQLRAFDPETLYAVKRTIARRALGDPNEARNEGSLEGIFTKLAAAQRETEMAQRAVRRIARDHGEEAYVLDDLQAATAFADLSRMDAGELSADARVVTLLALLDRMLVASDLPAHLRPYVVAEPLRIVFGGTPPTLPRDTTQPVERVAWLLYLSDVARQARHPVPDSTTLLAARQEAAVTGILDGIVDELRQSASAISPDSPLAEVTRLTIHALESTNPSKPSL